MGGNSEPTPYVTQAVTPIPPPPQLANTAVLKANNDVIEAGKAANGKGFAGTILTTPEGLLADGSAQSLHPKLLGSSV